MSLIYVNNDYVHSLSIHNVWVFLLWHYNVRFRRTYPPISLTKYIHGIFVKHENFRSWSYTKLFYLTTIPSSYIKKDQGPNEVPFLIWHVPFCQELSTHLWCHKRLPNIWFGIFFTWDGTWMYKPKLNI